MVSVCLLLVSIILILTSCNKEIEREYNKLYIDSFDYEVTLDENESSNSYLFSFDIDFSTKETSTNIELIVRITGLQNRSAVYSLNACNTENVSITYGEESFYANMIFAIPQGDTSMKASGTLSITTKNIIEDINDFVEISCRNRMGCEIVDYNSLMEQGTFKLNKPNVEPSDKIYYAYDEWTESYQVVSVYTKFKSLEIPAYHNDYPITTIDQAAFKQVPNIEHLVLPTTLISIPKGILLGMSNLKTLSLPFVGSGYSYLGYLFGASNSYENTDFVPKSLEEVVVTGTTTIPRDSFYGCSGIKRIVLNEITSIGDFAFSGCRELEAIELSDKLTSIGKMTFYGCGITSIVLPNTIESIGESAFYHCGQLKEVFYRGTEDKWRTISLGNNQLELNNATKYYYSDTKPSDAGHYWHEVDGVVTKW